MFVEAFTVTDVYHRTYFGQDHLDDVVPMEMHQEPGLDWGLKSC